MADESSTSTSSSVDKSPDDTPKQAQVPAQSGFAASSSGDSQTLPPMFHNFIPGLVLQQSQEQMNQGPGIYAIPVLPSMGGPVAGLSYNNLIPLTYNIPTTLNSRQSASDTGRSSEELRQAGLQQQPQPQAQPAPQRQVVVRRFQIAFQIDLFLILKLAAVIFLFNQDGSRQRLVLLIFLAAVVYLYQTGALTPLIRWLSQGMQRAAAPPRPPRHAVRAENVPAAVRQGNDNPVLAEGIAGNENENQRVGDGNEAVEDENAAQPDGGNGYRPWWGIIKEIQMIVFGFITSLMPGYHHHGAVD